MSQRSPAAGHPPSSHPLAPLIRVSAGRALRLHHSTLQKLLQHFKINPTTIETIHPVHFHLSWQPQLTTHVAEDKKAALSRIHTRLDDLQLFTDGSSHDGHIGAAAVSLDGTTSRQYKLGMIAAHTVFEAKLISVLLALQIVEEYPGTKSVLIALDNQAVIMALQSNQPQPSYYILDENHVAI